jgi:hypothetical protein
VGDDSNPGKPRQVKTAFIIRNTPAWLDQHQTWISDGARGLYKTLRSLADAKTGDLAIPGRGDEERWIKPTTIDKRAGISDETRKKYMRELIRLGAARFERKRVIRKVGNRLRAFLGVARYTVLPLIQPNASNDAGSSTAKNQENKKSPHKHSRSSTANSSTAKVETGLLRPNSCAAQGFGHEVLSETTTSGAAVPSLGPDEPLLDPGDSPGEHHRHQAPRKKPDDDARIKIYQDRPKLMAWAGRIVLRRARRMGKDVAFERGYIRASLPTFELESELRDFVKQAYEGYLYLCSKNRDQPFTRDILAQIILAQAAEHDLPIDEDFIRWTIYPPKEEPSEIREPIGPVDAARLRELAGADPACLSSSMDADGIAVMVYQHGIQSIRPSAFEPDWHPF